MRVFTLLTDENIREYLEKGGDLNKIEIGWVEVDDDYKKDFKELETSA